MFYCGSSSPDPIPLGPILDLLAEDLFYFRRIPANQRTVRASRLAERQGLPGAYAGTFAPIAMELRGTRLFTGELLRSRAGISHALGEETCRVLHVLQVEVPRVQSALARAAFALNARMEESEKASGSIGTYCCGTCTASYWRNLANGLLPRREERLAAGLAHLRRHRNDDGTWRRFPFHFTSLVLLEIGVPLAGEEMRYCAFRWRKILPRLERRKDDPYAQRRAEIGRRLLRSIA